VGEPVRPPECSILVRELNLEGPLCQKCISKYFFSFWHDDHPKGCWIAHTALTALECLRLRPRLEKPLRRLKIAWDEVEALAVLHDTGKLTEFYADRRKRWRRVGHNVFSMAIAANTYGRTYRVARAAFLHHEAFHWSEVIKRGLEHIGNTIKNWHRTAIIRGFRLRDGYEEAVEYLGEFLNALGIRELDWILDELMRRRIYDLRGRMPDELISYIDAKDIALYWVLYLADNRAASARDGPEGYWRYRLLDIVSECRDPAELTERLLKAKLHIALTAPVI